MSIDQFKAGLDLFFVMLLLCFALAELFIGTKTQIDGQYSEAACHKANACVAMLVILFITK